MTNTQEKKCCNSGWCAVVNGDGHYNCPYETCLCHSQEKLRGWEETVDALATSLVNSYGYRDAMWRNLPPNSHGRVDAHDLKKFFAETLATELATAERKGAEREREDLRVHIEREVIDPYVDTSKPFGVSDMIATLRENLSPRTLSVEGETESV